MYVEGGTSRGGFGGFWGANGRQTRPFGDEWDAGLGGLGEGAHKGRPYGWKVGRADMVVHREMIARAFAEGNV